MASTRYPLRATRNSLVTIILFVYNLVLDCFFWALPYHLRRAPKSVVDQNVLITGAGSGIGQLTALRFLRLGARVVLWDINQEGMRQTINMAQQEGLPAAEKMHTYRVDLSNRHDIYRAAELVLREVGTINILVNNAGVVGGNFLLDTPDDMFEMTFKVNTFAHFYTIKAFLPPMIRRGAGHIVTVASAAGHAPITRVADYCASKYANVGLEYSLRLELTQAGLDDQIAMTIVKPYLINTGMFSGARVKLLSQLEPDFVVDKLIEGVLYEREEVFLPSIMSIFVHFPLIFSRRCYALFYEFGGGFDLMSNFIGRRAPQQPLDNVLEMDTIKEESMEADDETMTKEDIADKDIAITNDKPKVHTPVITITEAKEENIALSEEDKEDGLKMITTIGGDPPPTVAAIAEEEPKDIDTDIPPPGEPEPQPTKELDDGHNTHSPPETQHHQHHNGTKSHNGKRRRNSKSRKSHVAATDKVHGNGKDSNGHPATAAI